MLFFVCLLTVVAPVPLYQMPDAQVDAFLADLQARNLPFAERIATIARAFVGAPYKDGPLGEGPDGRYDKDPLIDLSCADCVTFVEQVIALAVSKTCEETVQTLQRIRYKDGRVDFETRNHFMEADWVLNNAWCREVTRDLGVPVAEVTRTISKRAFFPKVNAPELGQDTPDREMTIAYVPLDQVPLATERIPSPSLILLIGKVDWLFAVHSGLFLRGSDGKAHFFHASSKAQKVIDDNLASYLKDSTRHLGFSAYRIDEPQTARP